MRPTPGVVYASPFGSDTLGTGSLTEPFATIAKATSAALLRSPTYDNPVVVLLLPGTFTENVELEPFVVLVALDPTSTDVNGNVSLHAAAWIAASSPYTSMNNFRVMGNLALDFTGVTSGGLVNYLNGYVNNSTTVIGDPTAGGALSLELVSPSDVSVTGASLLTDSCTYAGSVQIKSTSAQPAFWEPFGDTCDATAGVALSVDATAGQAATVLASGNLGTGAVGLTLSGALSAFTGSVTDIPSSVTRAAGAPPPVLKSAASGLAYTPAVLANWSGTTPASVADALDRIAAKIGPIP